MLEQELECQHTIHSSQHAAELAKCSCAGAPLQRSSHEPDTAQHGARAELTDLACAAFSSGLALGLNCNARLPAFLASATMASSASCALTLLPGLRAASMTDSCLCSAAARFVA